MMKRLLVLRMIGFLLISSISLASERTTIGLGLHAGKTSHGLSGRVWTPQRLGFQGTYHWENSQGESLPRLGLRVLYGLGENGDDRFYIGLGWERERARFYRYEYPYEFPEEVLRTLTRTSAFLGAEIDLQVFENPLILNTDFGFYKTSGNEGHFGLWSEGPVLVGLGLHYYLGTLKRRGNYESPLRGKRRLKWGRRGSTVGMAAGGILGGVVGLFGGAFAGVAIDPPGYWDVSVGGLIGASVGEVVGIPLGVHLANKKQGNFPLALLASLGVAGAGVGLTAATEEPAFLIATPIAQLIASIAVEQKTASSR